MCSLLKVTHIMCMTTKFCFVGSLPLEMHLSVAGAGEHALQIQVTDILDLQDQSNIEYSGIPVYTVP